MDLRKKLKSMLAADEQRTVAHAIELRSQSLGDLQFVYGREAAQLAALDADTIRAFFEDVLRIKSDTATDYYMATKHLLGEDNEA